MKSIRSSFAIILICLGIHDSSAATLEELRLWAQKSVDFFDRRTPKDCRIHLTYLSWSGDPIRDQTGRRREDRHIVATSRMAYGFAKAAALSRESDPDLAEHFLKRSKAYVDFVWSKMVKEGANGPYFTRAVDADGNLLNPDSGEPTDSKIDLILNVEQQAYGLSGLVAAYRETRDPDLLSKIDRLYSAFYKRFHDPKSGGFFDRYDRGSDSAIRTKSFNSSAYPVSAFLYELALLNPPLSDVSIPRPFETLLELGILMAKHFPDAKTGWIVENFAEDWTEKWHGWQSAPEGTIGIVGHNFQASWLLLQIAEIPEVPEAAKALMIGSAKQIISSMLKRPGVDHQYGGFFNGFIRESNQALWTTDDVEGPNANQSTKHWWQQVFGILSLSLAAKMGAIEPAEYMDALRLRDLSLEFYDRHFRDHINGGEFFKLKRDGSPIYSGGESMKGSAGKSAHHSLQLSWYLSQYLREEVLAKSQRPAKDAADMYGPAREQVVHKVFSPFPVGSSEWRQWYYGEVPASQLDWYPGLHISGLLSGPYRRADYPQIFDPRQSDKIKSPYPIGSPQWKIWYYEPVKEVNWYPGRHISGALGPPISRSQYPEIFE